MVITCNDFEGIAIASLGSSRFRVTEVFLWDDGPFVSKSKSSQRLKSGPAKGKWKDTHSKIPRTCHNGLRITPASNTGISAGSHLTGAGVDYCGIEYVESMFTDGSVDFSQIACKDTECEATIRNNNCFEIEGSVAFYGTFYVIRCFNNVRTHTSAWNLLSGKEHLAIVECIASDYSEALKASEECGTENNTILLEQTLIDENFEGKQCDEHSAGIGVAKVSDITKHSKDQSFDHSNEYLDRSSCNSGVSCSSISNTAENNISYNERCIPTISVVNRAHSENIIVEVSGLTTKSEPIISKEKYKVKRRRPEKFNDETREMPKECPATIKKYWQQRYILFSRFDDGIRMDEEGWFSVTPEVIAQYQAKRCAGDTIIDCFTGVGGNAIQFAKWCSNVIAIDIDPLKIEYARHNASIYGVENDIKFIVGDSFLLAPKLKADTVFLSPPWGGPDYNKVKTFDMKTMLKPHDGYTLFNAAKKIAHKVVMFLPKNVDFNQLAELALSARPPWSLEVEKVYLNGRLKAINAYFTDPLLLRR